MRPGIQEHVEISTKKKELNPKMKMGTNSFGVHIVKPYVRAGEEITIILSIYADRKPSHRKPSHTKEKTSQTVLRIYAYTLRSERNHSLKEPANYARFFSVCCLNLGVA